MITFLLLACHPTVPDSGALFDCAEVAIRDGENADPCDVSACENCVDHCGSECAVLESYPPQYSCGDQSWTVYDDCPDWEPPTSEQPSATEINNVGCGTGGAQLVATSSAAGRIDVTHDDYLLGCCPQDVEIGVSAADGTLSVEYTLIDDLCDCACMLDVSYAIVDVPAGHWTLDAPQSGASATVDVR